MAKKGKDLVKKQVQITLENVKVGTTIPDLHGEKHKVDNNLISQMEAFEKANPKSHAIWKDKITGTFLYFKYYEDNPEEKNKKKPGRKPKAEEIEDEEDEEEIEIEEDEDEELEDDEEDIEELDDEDDEDEEDETEDIEEAIEKNKLDEVIEDEVDEENLLKDCIVDYKAKYHTKTVNTKSQKFKQFFYKWKQENQ